jgi:glycosyltransferase involved in cell wall biosynthesis
VDADIYYQRSAGALTGVSAMFAKTYGRRFVYAAAHDLDFARDQTPQLFRRRAGWRDRQLFQLGLALADEVLAQHAGQVRDCQRWYNRVATTVPSCYVPPSTQQASANGVVLWVSTLRGWKRPELFLELARRLPHLRFRMVGGPAVGEQALFDRIREAAVALTNLEFVGFVPLAEIDAHFNAASVFVNTSNYEGFPNTFLQSWSRGIPTVSFANTGSTIDGEQVVTVASSVEEMVSLVGRLMHDANYWKITGGRARNCYKTFHTPEAAMAVYSRVFDTQWNAMKETLPSGAQQRSVLQRVTTPR